MKAVIVLEYDVDETQFGLSVLADQLEALKSVSTASRHHIALRGTAETVVNILVQA